MSRMILRTLVLLSAVAAWHGAFAVGILAPQASSESAVTVKVTPKALTGPMWEFEVVFDTHTQPLNDDLMKNAVLVLADGTQVAPASWQADPPGGHHRKGILRFNAPVRAQSMVELRITRPGEARPRSFKWKRE